jgi:hypothetical protein
MAQTQTHKTRGGAKYAPKPSLKSAYECKTYYTRHARLDRQQRSAHRLQTPTCLQTVTPSTATSYHSTKGTHRWGKEMDTNGGGDRWAVCNIRPFLTRFAQTTTKKDKNNIKTQLFTQDTYNLSNRKLVTLKMKQRSARRLHTSVATLNFFFHPETKRKKKSVFFPRHDFDRIPCNFHVFYFKIQVFSLLP